MGEAVLQSGPIDLNDLKNKMELAETLSKMNMMTSASARRRIKAKSYELKFGRVDETSGVYIPPRELLMYMVRMGSLSSTPKILNGDNQDNDVLFPERISRNELMRHCFQKSNVDHTIRRTFRRKELRENGSTYRKQSIRVLQWNILSQALGVMHDNFAKCPPEALDWSSRRYKIISEIVKYTPDVICLQEVDHFNFLKNALGSQGYNGVFFPKPDSPCYYINDNNGPDGCAIFFKKEKFDHLQTETRVLEIWGIETNQVAILVRLRERESSQEMCVVTTHLKARKGALLATMRNEQSKDMLRWISESAIDCPVIISGDFNAEPSEPTYKTMRTSNLGLASAYDFDDGEPPYTTWKIRGDGEVCHTIDYVFYTEAAFDVAAVLEMPTSDAIGRDRVPSFEYPSDHFSLVADFAFRDQSDVYY